MFLKKSVRRILWFLCGSLSVTCRSYLPRPPLIISPLFFFPPTFPTAIGNANPRIYIRHRQVNELYTKASFHALPFSSFFPPGRTRTGMFSKDPKIYVYIVDGWSTRQFSSSVASVGIAKRRKKKRGFAIRENCVGVSARIKPNYADEIRTTRFPSGWKHNFIVYVKAAGCLNLTECARSCVNPCSLLFKSFKLHNQKAHTQQQNL